MTWPTYAKDEVRAVVRVLRSGKVNQWGGSEVRLFEEEFAQYVGAEYAVAFSNGSLALEAAFTCLPERDVTVPARSFVATAFSALRSGKRVHYVDVTDEGLSAHPVTCTVHLGGKVSEVPSEIEDCAQAMGARYKLGGHVGTRSKIGVFSFCQDKILSTGGEGGMAVTSDYMAYRKLWSWKDHGKSYEKVHEKTYGSYNFCHTSIGTNARMTEIQAAIGRVQLPKVKGWVTIRLRQAAELRHALQLTTLRCPMIHPWESGYRYAAYLTRGNRDKLLRAMLKAKVPVGQGSCPEIYREQAVYSGDDRCLQARELGMTSVTWKTDPTLSRKEWTSIVRKSVEAVRAICSRSES